MRLARALLVGHAVALVFGLAGMLIALPHPELWSASPLGQQAFAFGMQYAGPLHMVLGAAAMLAFGGAALGWRRTLLFFAPGLRPIPRLGADRDRHRLPVRQLRVHQRPGLQDPGPRALLDPAVLVLHGPGVAIYWVARWRAGTRSGVWRWAPIS